MRKQKKLRPDPRRPKPGSAGDAETIQKSLWGPQVLQGCRLKAGGGKHLYAVKAGGLHRSGSLLKAEGEGIGPVGVGGGDHASAFSFLIRSMCPRMSGFWAATISTEAK